LSWFNDPKNIRATEHLPNKLEALRSNPSTAKKKKKKEKIRDNNI
jgi:hypothetical protein